MSDEKKSWLKRLTEGLKKTSSALTDGITSIVLKRKLDAEVLEELEDLMIQADMGLKVTRKFIEEIARTRFNQEVSETEIKQALVDVISPILHNVAKELVIDKTLKPHVIFVVGVNGSGKTTTIGKMAKLWKDQGLSVRLVAADTFRAAAVDQLLSWGKNAGVPVESAPPQSDAASLVYEALEKSIQEKDDLLIIDTAGRLQNKSNLMDELGKMTRVIQKLLPEAPHHCLLVLDATTGQNAHSQVELFQQTAQINGLVMTKLDGTAKGGVLVSLAEKFALPIYAIGVGESADDLRPLNAEDFARKLVGI
ncbi:MAG: signal recognition particle-docking protein FtsY [Alphaproteobacteria bacterium]|nr:signal recognition particle-docking protein FtsY [Alphaproteobacteria bacterium]